MGEVSSNKRQRVEKAITFTWVDSEGVQYPHNDTMVVTFNITDYNVYRMLVDNEKSVDVLFYDAFLKINILLE